MTVDDDEAGGQPANAEQHPVEGHVRHVLAEVVHGAAEEVPLISVSVPAQEGGEADHDGHTPDPDDDHLHPQLAGPLVALLADDPGPLQGEVGQGPDGGEPGHDGDRSVDLQKYQELEAFISRGLVTFAPAIPRTGPP